ncbi:MAG TPA: valine--tRNA ligase, partial [Terriglobales bacterium]|nr:valine--tRNA ligase [Terriglobales bacterium]
RNVRAELKVEPKTKAPIDVYAHDADTRRLLDENRGAVERLANVEGMSFVDESLAKKAGARSTARFDVHVLYERKIDVGAECARLLKDLQGYERELESKQKQLSNEEFRSKAPGHVVQNMQKRLDELQLLSAKTRASMDELGCNKGAPAAVRK